ncbi:beta-galactosidase [uncultured Desulfobulbus sp.]|uniref:beta-galactosidase n=1 Tax=uncultured Desulfobulbus sp. TaxID=239745 RepID=UPI0029C91F0E|nr:beta-galactosidase [uncultured Desulfobulbus sp.]
MKLKYVLLALLLIAGAAFGVANPKPAPVNQYSIHEDGGLVYDPLRREAASTGQLARYANVPTQKKQIKLGDYILNVSVPKKVTAYDVVPIPYTLTWTQDNGRFPVAVEATGFEDAKRRGGRDLYDLALPGKIDLKFEYLGSITANWIPGARHNMKPDMSDKPGEYPGFARKQFTRSGAVESGDLIWFKFRYKNTGNTILDPEGIGGCQFYPEIDRKNKDGQWEMYGYPYNLYIRDLKYLYPGESHEMWVNFAKWPYGDGQNFGLPKGEYLIKLRLIYRSYKDFNAFQNIWEGLPAYVYEMPITVEYTPQMAPVDAGKITFTDGNDPDKLTRWIHTHEEFMTAFDCYLKKPESAAKTRSVKGTLNLQVAPWTKNVVVKLIADGPVSISSFAIPIDVDSKSLKVKYNAKNQVTLTKNGIRQPVVWSQSMADMRSNIQIGPFPEVHIRERMHEMMNCGINIVASTSMPWLYDDMYTPKANTQGDAWKYFLDCARRDGMTIEGWGAYPYDRSTIQGISNWITGKNVQMDTFMSGYPAISHTDPNLPAADAAAWLYQFHRWGDLYYQMERGDVPIGIEDTRGWMRQDVNIRYQEGDRTMAAFRDWCKAKYGTISAANTAWRSSFNSFDEVNPEANQVLNVFGQRWEFTDPKNVFHDWSPAIADFDEFRTDVRVKNYKDTLDIIRKEIPTVKFLLRTEGGNVIVSGINPEDPNTHMRHIFYSQRRVGAIAEIMQKSGLLSFHSDYTTMPYTPSEIRMLTRMEVKQGIIPAYLPCFDNMRDIAVNDKYGTDFQVHYNINEPKKGQMMHSLLAVYPWFKAVYEEGGVPGITWDDYQCDAFATETQKKEMLFFKQKLTEAMSTPAAKKARTADIKHPSQDWRKYTKKKWSYKSLAEEH